MRTYYVIDTLLGTVVKESDSIFIGRKIYFKPCIANIFYSVNPKISLQRRIDLCFFCSQDHKLQGKYWLSLRNWGGGGMYSLSFIAYRNKPFPSC